jgi:tetratricopeptide (TPR) repeat protein
MRAEFCNFRLVSNDGNHATAPGMSQAGRVCRRVGHRRASRRRTADAERTLRQRLIHAPDDLQVLAKLAELLSKQGRRLEATLVFKGALAAAPDAHSVRLALAELLEKQGLFEAALEEMQSLGEPLRSSIEARVLEAALLGYLGRHEEQIPIYEDLLASFPNRAVVWMYFGNALKTVGRTEDAVKALRKAIRIRPHFGEAYWNLANLKTFRFRDQEIAAMRRALRNGLNDADAIHLHFALGKALEVRGDIEGSFNQYSAGNRMRAAQFPEGLANITPRSNGVVDTFDEALFDRFETRAIPPATIFIVGMQRSGSTLIEQILASHPMIEGTSELTIIEQMWLRLGGGTSTLDGFGRVPDLKLEEFRSLGAEYLERSRAFRRTDRPFFVDKLNGNWLNVGFIRLILPNARIIDARRHPMASWAFPTSSNCVPPACVSYDLEVI